MVAELSGISATTAKQKTSSGSRCDIVGEPVAVGVGDFDKLRKKRPRWIEASTREPIYSVLDGDDERTGSQCKDAVIITAVCKNPAGHPRRLPSEERPSPEGIGDPETRIYNEEDAGSQPLYSVIQKRKPNPQPEVLSKQEVLRKWLQTASNQIPPSRFTSNPPKMYSSEYDDNQNTREDWKRSIPSPRGVVGLVGPYRVYQNPSERREYILEEEELVEENIDSVSEVPSREMREVREVKEVREVREDRQSELQNHQEEHRRAKWKIREDDEETLVPDIMVRTFSDCERDDDLEIKDDVIQDVTDKIKEWRKLEMMNGVASSQVEGIISGKEERAVDVPEAVDRLTKSTNGPASNEQHDKDSLNETGSTTGGTVEGAPGGSPGRGERSKETESPAQEATTSALPPRSLVSRILARARSPEELLDHSEPFSQLWIVLSNVYGELVVIMMMALCLAEVMDTPVPLLSLQGIFLMYMYVGSIAVIISIYIWVLIDSCSSLGRSGLGIDDAELGGASLTRFGSLKRAHISRARTTTTSFYIRVGALLFGLATLIFNGLEMAMHSMMQGGSCLSDIVFVHPVLHGLFTFLQMHFLFVNSQVLVERFGLAARFGFTHLAATNIAVWARLVIWDSALEWTYFVHLAQRGPQTSSSPLHLRGFPHSLTRHTRDVLGEGLTGDDVYKIYEPISKEQISQVVALQDCLNGSSLGQLWTSSLPYLYPFIVQFSLIAAAVTFVMGQNVGRGRSSHKHKFHSIKDLGMHGRAGCDGSSKGLFLGILCMVAGIVVILIFLVVREDENFPPSTLSWLTCGTLIAILSLSGLMTASGLVQIRQMSIVTRAPAALDNLLSNVSLFGIQLYSVFTIVVCICSLNWIETDEFRGRHIMLLSASVLQLIQSYAQSTLMAEASKRSCITRYQITTKPARQVIAFLLFSNAVLWTFDTVITHNWISQELQLRFFGVLAWGIISRIGLPLLIFYRFHSCVLLLEAWNKCYRTPRGDHPLN